MNRFYKRRTLIKVTSILSCAEDIENIVLNDSFYFSFAAEREVCKLLRKGNVMAIFGPQSEASSEHIKSITDAKEIPFIDTRYLYI